MVGVGLGALIIGGGAAFAVASYLKKKKEGRRNLYTVNPKGRLRHPLESHHTVGQLIDALD